MEKRIVFYCRVSTAQQEKEETIEVQQLKLKEIYGEHKEYLDNGVSGGSLDRPAMNQLREDAKRGLFDVVAVYSLSRLSRKAYHQIKLREEFKKDGVVIEVMGKDIGDDNRFGRMGNSVMGLFYEFERDDITEKMKDGKFKLAGKGNLVGCNAPYGYTLNRRDRLQNTMAEFVINPIEAKGIKEVFSIYKEKQSLRHTIRALAEKGIIARNGKPFIKKTLTRILGNEIYIGNFYWGKCACHKDDETKKVSRVLKPKESWKLIKVPAIVDETIFRQVQEILQYRKKA
jgi:site-specific DNA recombinase